MHLNCINETFIGFDNGTINKNTSNETILHYGNSMDIKQSQLEDFFKHLVKQLQAGTPCLRCIGNFSKYFGINEKTLIHEIFHSDYTHSVSSSIKLDLNGGDTPGISAMPVDENDKPVQQKFFDFSKQKCIEGEKQTSLPQNQLWSLLQHGIRTKCIYYLDGFFLFDWTVEITNPKRQFGSIVSKADHLIHGITFQHENRKADIWELTGLEKTQHTFNIIEAKNLLKNALSTIKKGNNWDVAVDNIVQAFKLDPKYINLAFCVVEIITNAPNVVFPSEMLKDIYKLLQSEQEKYQKGIYAIENCHALVNADIKDYLLNCHAKLEKITLCSAHLLRYLRNNNIPDIDDSQTNDIRLYIERIRSSCKNMKEVFKCQDFRDLCNRNEIQNVCNSVTMRLLKYADGLDYNSDYFKEAFQQHFAQLILDKINPAKLNTPFSLAAYCRETILPDLRDKVFNEKYGMSYKTFIAILQKRRVAEQLYHSSGHRPTDLEIAKEMKVTLDRFYEIKAAESSLSHNSFDDELDSYADNEEDEDFSES
jgi:hypothetical protein